MRPVKAVQFRYVASDELASLFEDFRLMCNDAIRIALKERPRSRFALIEMAYPPTEGVRSSHPLHPVCMRGSLLGLSEQGQKVRPVHRESVPQAGQPELLAESLAPENPHHPETLRLPDSPSAPTIISPSSLTLPSRGAPSRSPAARSASPSRRRLRRRRLWERSASM